jgi:hypothetical protein
MSSFRVLEELKIASFPENQQVSGAQRNHRQGGKLVQTMGENDGTN